MVNLFVYGTLKQGHSNHGVLLQSNAKFLGHGHVFGIQLTEGPGFPYAYVDKHVLQPAVGELYELDHLSYTDRLEGYPYHYNRIEVPVHLANGNSYPAWIYVAADDSDYERRVKCTDNCWIPYSRR